MSDRCECCGAPAGTARVALGAFVKVRGERSRTANVRRPDATAMMCSACASLWDASAEAVRGRPTDLADFVRRMQAELRNGVA